MASPQLNHGHTRIANEILEKIMKINLNGTQFRLVMAVWRYTYGFSRKTTKYGMSISQLAELIDASRSQVDRELKSLIEQNIITVNGVDSKGARILSFQKNYKEWGKKQVAPSHKKEKKTKSNKMKKYDEQNTYYKMAKYFHERISIVAKEAGVEHLIAKANLQRYADDFRKLVELDGVDKRQVKEVIDWVTQDEFWKTNILSAAKLRQQFMKLAIRMNADKNKQQPKQQYDSRDKEIEFQRFVQGGGDPDDFNWN
ncbi:replication protein [Pseudogracilibacillus auburnensis]|uniref:replication protein n=1 Tax=Pseudogracilibacillus auburnensis TaxID=1494959 RepID=UPI001A965F77|nr:replication protein [Pseudogracilibacillus auburnensis]MBO1003144.1 replication protein [Pseudogracilibacillus auburnensis]